VDPRLPRLPVANATFITSQLLVGGDLEVFNHDLATEQLDELVTAGVTDIVDLRLEWNDASWVLEQMPHLRYFHLGVDDAGQRMRDAWFDTGTDLVLSRLRENPQARVLVHCHLGVNRGPSMGFAVLLAQGWDPLEAMDAIRTARPVAYIGYAEDALDWWLRRDGETRDARRNWQRRLTVWRSHHDLGMYDVIREIRADDDRRGYGFDARHDIDSRPEGD
jgi:dual specificity phosphatase 3